MCKMENLERGSYFFFNLGNVVICKRECSILIVGNFKGRNRNNG